MAGIKYSKQREAILAYLHSTTEHPTAETIYTNLKQENAKLSLGTVYRNLNLLAASGEIQKEGIRINMRGKRLNQFINIDAQAKMQ